VPALRALTQDFGERSGLETTFTAANRLPSLSADTELAVFRSVQESLANVVRHADAGAVSVALGVEAGDIVLRVRDNGRGLPSGKDIADFEAQGHMGLTGMRERIAALGGTLAVGSLPGRGTEIVVRVPPEPK
jgi:signal transduction histidine kinase